MSAEVICIDSDSDDAPRQLLSNPTNLSFLAECFPGVTRNLLVETLEKAHGNVDSAVQSLSQIQQSPPDSPVINPNDDILDLSRGSAICVGGCDDGNACEDGKDNNCSDDDDELGIGVIEGIANKEKHSSENSADDDLLRPFRPKMHSSSTRLSTRAPPPRRAVASEAGLSRQPIDTVPVLPDSALFLDDDNEHELAPAARKDLRRRKREAAKLVDLGESMSISVPGSTSAAAPATEDEPAGGAKRRRLTAEEREDRIRKKKEEKERLVAQRVAARLEKARLKAVEQRLAIAASFERFESQSLDVRRREIAIVLPEEMSQGKAGQTVVAMLRAVFPNQLLVEKDMPIANGVLWRRRVPRVDIRCGEFRLGDVLEFIAVCFEAALFCQHVENGSVEGLVRHLFLTHPGKRVEFVVEGVELHCKRSSNRTAREGAGSGLIVSEEAVRDCCMMLYMEYGVSTRHVKDPDALSDYLVELTESLACAPHATDSDFLDANVEFWHVQAGGRSAGAMTGIPMPTPGAQARASEHQAGVGEDEAVADGSSIGEAAAADPKVMLAGRSDDEDEDEDEGEDGDSTWTGAPPLVRVEDARDYGVMYLNWLSAIPGVSLDKAKAMRAAHGTLGRLLRAYSRCETDRARDALLVDVRVGSGRRRIGPVISRVIARALNSVDPDELVRSARDA
jgi:ERCC4 domain